LPPPPPHKARRHELDYEVAQVRRSVDHAEAPRGPLPLRRFSRLFLFMSAPSLEANFGPALIERARPWDPHAEMGALFRRVREHDAALRRPAAADAAPPAAKRARVEPSSPPADPNEALRALNRDLVHDAEALAQLALAVMHTEGNAKARKCEATLDEVRRYRDFVDGDGATLDAIVRRGRAALAYLAARLPPANLADNAPASTGAARAALEYYLVYSVYVRLSHWLFRMQIYLGGGDPGPAAPTKRRAP
jgi:hypothetical protein